MSIFAFSIHLYLISMDPWIIEHAHTHTVHNSHFAKMLYDCLNFWLMIMSWTSHTHSYYSIKTKEMLCVSIVRMEQKANSILKRKKSISEWKKAKLYFIQTIWSEISIHTCLTVWQMLLFDDWKMSSLWGLFVIFLYNAF